MKTIHERDSKRRLDAISMGANDIIALHDGRDESLTALMVYPGQGLRGEEEYQMSHVIQDV